MIDLPGWLLIVPVLGGLVFVHELGHFLTAKLFRIQVNGDDRFEQDQVGGTADRHEVDISDVAGATIDLTLITDCKGDASYDWAHWLRPAIVRE